MLGLVEKDLRAAYAIPDKMARHKAVDAAKAKVMAHFLPEGVENPPHPKQQVGSVFKELEAKIVRWNILDTGRRIDGRDVKTVRPIVSEVGILPRAHGSALFTRGETQALVIATLGTGEDEQYVDALPGTYKETFLLHYNFPPFSVGETGRLGSPGRREVGHGKLAWRAIHPMLPAHHEFPYTLRVVSEVTEADGSSAMGTLHAHAGEGGTTSHPPRDGEGADQGASRAWRTRAAYRGVLDPDRQDSGSDRLWGQGDPRDRGKDRRQGRHFRRRHREGCLRQR